LANNTGTVSELDEKERWVRKFDGLLDRMENLCKGLNTSNLRDEEKAEIWADFWPLACDMFDRLDEERPHLKMRKTGEGRFILDVIFEVLERRIKHLKKWEEGLLDEGEHDPLLICFTRQEELQQLLRKINPLDPSGRFSSLIGE